MENTALIQVGINKTLLEKRISLGLSRKDAAKKIGISKFKLTVLERGYLKLKQKHIDKIKVAYNVNDDFFYDNYLYPVTIDEKLYEPVKINKLLAKFSESKIIKIISGVLAVGFLAMCIASTTQIPKIKGNTAEYYSAEVREVKDYIVQKGKEESGEDEDDPILDKKYTISDREIEIPLRLEEMKITVYGKDANLPYLKFGGKMAILTTEQPLLFDISHRYMDNSTKRVHCTISTIQQDKSYESLTSLISNVSVDSEGNYKYSYSSVIKLNSLKGNEQLSPGSPDYINYTNYFETHFPTYLKDVGSFFDRTELGSSVNYEQFDKACTASNTSYYANFYLYRAMCISGLLLGVIFIGIICLALLEKKSIAKKIMAPFDYKEEERDIPSTTVAQEMSRKELPRNKWMNLVVPEFFVRTLSLVLLFLSSIATYFLFVNVLRINLSGIIGSFIGWELLSNLSVIAVMLLYFVKLDIYQNKKSAFGYNLFLFILGIAYYLALLIVYYAILGSGSKLANIMDPLFSFLPGNIVWGVLVFNLIIIYMFAPINDRFNNDKKKIVLFRLRTLLPFAYLVASSIISIGSKVYGWKLPYAVGSLFFTKAPMITIFAIVYCVAIFIYRKRTIRIYGAQNGIIYQNSNKYNYIRNIIAASIILAIGVADLMFYFFYKDNPFGFGSNYLMLVAIPFILFYHPHIQKRNGTWDLIFNILYGIVYILGIVLIILAVLYILTIV